MRHDTATSPDHQRRADDVPLPERSLRRQFLPPFCVGVALLSIAVGLVAAWGARDAAQSELANRARTAARIFDVAMVTQQTRLEREAFGLATDPDIVRALQRGTALRDLDIPSTLSNRFDYVAVNGPRGGHVFASRLADWSVLRAPRLLEQVSRGVAQSGIVIARDGTAALFAAAPVHVAAPRDGAIILAEPITAGILEELTRPLDLVLELRTSGDQRISSVAAARDPGARVRAYSYRPQLSRFSAGDARLTVELSTAPLRRATAAAAMTAAVTALGLAMTLLLLVVFLLERAVVRPLSGLRAAIAQVKHGSYDVQVPLGGSRELAEAADGFQRMAAIVGEQQAQLHAQATRDPLTGLANHAAFHAALDAAVEASQDDGSAFGVLAIDVDYFKDINDQRGHPFGDAVLRAIADELRASIRDDDTASRLGGDEFAVLLRGADAAGASEAAERILERTRSIEIGDHRLSLSIGVSCFPAHGRDATTLIEFADQALYESKRAGRGQTRRYDEIVPAGGVRAAHPADEREELLELLERTDAIVPVFQPIVSLRTGSIERYEALARFPAGTDRATEAWFAQAHRCHLGPELEARAVEAALAVPGRPAGVELALNVSPDTLATRRLMSALPEQLDAIVLEVTERQRVADSDVVRSRLSALRARGARIALDDAGEGYAGLGQLLRVQPEIIKLDRSLIEHLASDPARMAVVEAFVRIAQRTGAEVCAEGIETLEQAHLLAELGVSHGQGYALARPGRPWPALEPGVAAALIARAADRRDPYTTTRHQESP